MTTEPLAKLNKTFTPGTSGAQKTLKNLDSGFCMTLKDFCKRLNFHRIIKRIGANKIP
jgi:hypothetical protein